jgi:hypothetical protein
MALSTNTAWRYVAFTGDPTEEMKAALKLDLEATGNAAYVKRVMTSLRDLASRTTRVPARAEQEPLAFTPWLPDHLDTLREE